MKVDYSTHDREWFVKMALVSNLLTFIDMTTYGNKGEPIREFWNNEGDHGAWWDIYFDASDQPWKRTIP